MRRAKVVAALEGSPGIGCSTGRSSSWFELQGAGRRRASRLGHQCAPPFVRRAEARSNARWNALPPNAVASGVARCGITMPCAAELELLTGLEPVTSSLPRKCSTPELQELFSTSSLKDQGPVTQAAKFVEKPIRPTQPSLSGREHWGLRSIPAKLAAKTTRRHRSVKKILPNP